MRWAIRTTRPTNAKIRPSPRGTSWPMFKVPTAAARRTNTNVQARQTARTWLRRTRSWFGRYFSFVFDKETNNADTTMAEPKALPRLVAVQPLSIR